MLRTMIVCLAASASLFGQQAISVRSGLVHLAEGKATLDGTPVNLRFGAYPIMKDGAVLRTATGRVELLLTPGAFLRMDNNTAVKMVSGKLSDTLVEVSSGAALVEVAGLEKEHRVTVRVGGLSTELVKPGLYRFDASPARVRVFDGRAEVTQGKESLPLTRGKETVDTAVLMAAKFSTKDYDELYVWSKARAASVAQANMVAARSLRSTGSSRSLSNMWLWNPAYGLVTYIPRSGAYHSAFGYYYYSPSTIWQAYSNYGGYNSGGGNYGGSQSSWSGMSNSPSYNSSSSGYSAPVMSDSGRASVSASAPAVSAPAGGRGR
ncbi:MAG: FecR domain-containing protein [Acidobacteria bacterium]|nr:FecR domain-containing protein [Acidobacteriota bacterium]